MALLAEYMLQTARLITTVIDGTVEAQGTNYIYDSNIHLPNSVLDGGVLFVSTGSSQYEVRDIDRYYDKEIFYSGSSMGDVVGMQYSASYGDFSLNDIQQACSFTINNVLIPHEMKNINVSSGIGDLPAGVNNVRRVIDGSNKINYHWDELGGKIIFDDKGYNDNVTIIYLARSNVREPDDSVDNYIDIEYIAWASAAFLWRRKIQRMSKDNQVGVELLNEAKTNELIALTRSRRYSPSMFQRDVRMAKL